MTVLVDNAAAMIVLVDNAAAVMARTAPLDEHVRPAAGSDPVPRRPAEACEGRSG
jgi:hypothetical protein